MSSESFTIPAIHCGHCIMTIKRELSEINGVAEVSGDLGAKKITVTFDAPASAEAIASTLQEIGYPAA